jgi:hypothetical protein
VLVALAAVLAACGGGTPTGDVGAAQVAVNAPPPTTAISTTTTTVPARPVRVMLAGDSIMGGLAPAVKAALAGGRADVRYKLTPAIQGDPPLRLSWEQELPVFDPDVIVLFLGVWETVTAAMHGYDIDDPAGRARYEQEILDPWVRFITSDGARVVWIGHAPVDRADIQPRLVAYEPLLQALPDRWPQVRYLSSTPALNGEDAGFHASVIGADGRRVRTRQVDGLHLCPDGAARLAAVLLGLLDLPATSPDWPTGPWRADAKAFPPGTCPA